MRTWRLVVIPSAWNVSTDTFRSFEQFGKQIDKSDDCLISPPPPVRQQNSWWDRETGQESTESDK